VCSYSICYSFRPSDAFFEGIEIIVYLETKNRKNTGTQGQLKWLIHVLQHETGDAGRPREQMNRQFILWVSESASDTKLLERKEEEYMICRDVTGPFNNDLGSRQFIKK
jgi:hypothetical protein